MISFRMTGGDIALRKLAAKIGENTKEATTRLAVSVAREAAVETLPFGNSKKQIQGAIERDARRAMVTVDGRTWNRMQRSRRPRLRENGKWREARPDQLKRDAKEADSHIERLRGKDGKVPVVPFERKIVVPKAESRRVIVQRKKRAGITKGGWIGAGIAAGRGVVTIGRNFMAWAQKHRDHGRARRSAGGNVIYLKNASSAAANLTKRNGVRKASTVAWRKTSLWYKREIRRIKV